MQLISKVISHVLYLASVAGINTIVKAVSLTTTDAARRQNMSSAAHFEEFMSRMYGYGRLLPETSGKDIEA